MTNPKVSFISIPLCIEIKWMYGFLFYNRWGWEKKILKTHPVLGTIYKYRTRKDREIFLRSYILRHRKEKRTEILQQMRMYEKEWRRVEKKYFATLAEVLEISWPKRKKIFALVSINPICPRFLNTWSFSIFYNQQVKDMLETVMHETCHFLYFAKWKEVFPKVKNKTFERPYLEWHLSEILAPVILQDQRIQKLLCKKPVFYKEFKKIKIENISVPVFFERLYKKYVRQGKDFTHFLEEAYKIMKRNRALFKF